MEGDRHSKTMAMIVMAIDTGLLNYVAESHVAYEGTYAEMMDLLHELRSRIGNYKRIGYFENTCLLEIDYAFPEYRIVLYCTDLENALEKIGKGKCTLETFDTTEKRIVCAV